MRNTTQPSQQVADEFTTQDVKFAAVLKKEGFSFMEWRKEKGSFVFQASWKIEEIKQKYDNGELIADPYELVYFEAVTIVCRK